ncbi:MAG: DHH family phosphoesterase, partial [Oscillospiraceae bacterium]
MKRKRWLSFKLTGLGLLAVTFASIFFVKKIDEFQFWVLLSIASVVGLVFVAEMVLAQNNIHKFIAQMDEELNVTGKDGLYNFPNPTIITDEAGTIIWYNQAFSDRVFSGDDPFGISLDRLVDVDLDSVTPDKPVIVMTNGKNYKLMLTITEKSDSILKMYYFEDVTEYIHLQDEFQNSRPSVVLIVIDNYEDLLQNLKESEKAHVLVQLEKLLENFMDESTGIIRKISSDRFFAVIEEKHLCEIIEKRFKILDMARAITVSDKLNVTLSIGVGHSAATLKESEEFAKQSLDMALGRGGDQAAVKTENGFEFFGGVSKGIEKHAKVKTRIIATALLELINTSEKVYIMGHRFGDLDSLGSAVGLGGAIHNLGKYVRVVVDPEKNLGETLIQRINDCEDFRLFISPQEAVADINEQTLLIIVDTHNKDFVESGELYQKAKHIVVIDHHRKVLNFIDNAVIFHHEPYASSASEMVAELIQYFTDINKLSSYYAEALLAGIMLDTKSFVMRTGVRTFEAAAFLRKMGADTVAVRGLFANSIDAYQKKTKLVASAEVYERCAIAVSDISTEDIRVIAPQAADELLGISGVDASFVIYDLDGVIGFSARSMGAMNVQ